MGETQRQSLIIGDVSFTYPTRETPALSGVNLTARPGEFIVLCGPSGCGKTTLLKHCKPALAPHGRVSGEIFFGDTPLQELSDRDAASKIVFVQQNPENQIVTDKVWHELAFGLESLGFDTPAIRLRVAEMASFFGIQDWFYKSVTELSGGQKQLLTLASVMAMDPSVLILDEPTSQLDPIAASELLQVVGKINRELGITVLLTEHRLEEAFPLCSRAVVMDKGRILFDGAPAEVGDRLRSAGHDMFLAMPTPMRVWAGTGSEPPCPVTVRDGREWISRLEIKHPLPEEKPPALRETPAVELEEVWFKYGKDLPDVLSGLSFKAYPGEIAAILGGNGTGKTTSLSLISGLNKPYRGMVKLNGQDIGKIPVAKRFDRCLGVLPQNPQALFVHKTVREDLFEALSEIHISKGEKRERIEKIARLCRLTEFLDVHPYDLSGGEQQRAALAKVLLLEPRILLLDEPTKGLDAEFKQVFAEILRRLARDGVTIVIVSHDIEFCAEYADTCALFFAGEIVSQGSPRRFFSGNSFYTSAANRMARHMLPEAVTVGDLIIALGGTPPTQGDGSSVLNCIQNRTEEPSPCVASPGAESARKLSPARKAVMGLALIGFIVTAVFTGLHFEGFKSFISGGAEAVDAAARNAWRYVGIMAAFAAEAMAFVAAWVYQRGGAGNFEVQSAKGSRRLPKRTVAAAALILIAIPVTIYIGVFYFGSRKYYFIALLIILEAMLPFALIFEGRKPRARELVILSVMIAIAVAGRAAFFMLPQFKPVAAVVIIAGVAFGGEAGFLVGALSSFVSNMMFGQGPWTPWQMFAFGIIGFLAGVLFKKGVLLRSRSALCIFGGLATFIIYGGLVNPSIVLMAQPDPTWPMFLAAYLQGIPFDLIHALATVFFLAVISRPMLEKLDRIKVKYGLVEAAPDS
ncbi:MAG: ATP-binding cassette domain-containing protein [Clostridiales Family XIII bacterium]|jgi:energy-coupling factor transport system ATP-binding protein|nr:ATP-binding cassette domain-containing protein [Clostridiales Family XIII bacterium]